MPHHSAIMWLLFAATIAALVGIDLRANRGRNEPRPLDVATRWVAIVLVAAAVFGSAIWWRSGRANAIQFTTGYVIELALSVDNLLVFILVLRYFAVPEALHATVLKWGILGAIVMRAMMIGAGTLLVREFSWVLYLLGALLVYTGARLLYRSDDETIEPDRSLALRAARRLLPITPGFHGNAFMVRDAGRWRATPLLLVVLVVEWTDLVFATDSVPAIFAITRDPFLVYTSNIFAILGLRALYFVLAGMIARFVYLRPGVAVVLVLVGLKMLASRWIRVEPVWVLAGVVAILAVAVGASVGKKES